MQLEFSRLRSAIFGALEAEQDGTWFRFFRFTARQRAIYRDKYPEFYTKTLGSAGIRLDLETDAEELSLDYRIRKASSRNWYSFDGYVNGVLTTHLQGSVETEPEGNFRILLPQGTHRVTVYLPCLSAAELSNLTLKSGTVFRPFIPQRRLLCLGDSITHGYDATYPSFAYPNLLAAAWNAEVVNQGIGGERFNADALDPDLNYQPNLITVAYGTNDWSHGSQTYFSDTEQYLEQLHRSFPNTPTAVILPIWRADAQRITPVGTFEEARRFLQNTAEKYANIRVIDGLTLTPHLPEFYSDRYLHPNDIGFQIYAANLLRQLKKYFSMETYL